MSVANQVFLGIALYVIGSVTFDLVHYLLHLCWLSKNKYLMKLGYLHQVHHFYFNRRLKFNQNYSWSNILIELPLEYFSQFLGYCLGYWLLQEHVYAETFWVLTAFGAVRSFIVACMNGMDSNHIIYEGTVPKDPNTLICGPEFHVLHHIYPDRYYSSFVRVFDWILGTSYDSLRDKRITMTGTSGAFGGPLMDILLTCEGAKSVTPLKYGRDFTYDDYSKVVEILENTDILILAHGSKVKGAMEANCTSFVTLIELFKKHRKPVGQIVSTLPEIWAVGSEIEFHPAWGNRDLQIYLESKRAFVQFAREYYDQKDFIYRHIVPSAFQSAMGPGLISGRTAVQMAMFFIRRGFQYIPVTYTTLAFFNYFKFIFFVTPKQVRPKQQ